MKTKQIFFYTFPNKKIIINVNTGSSNGRGWGVIDLPRNQSACWESTARPEQMMGDNRRQVQMSKGVLRENKQEENNICYSHTALTQRQQTAGHDLFTI